MRIVHLSDTHLGFSAYSKLDRVEGINQREMDIYRAFEQAVDKTLELKPDLVVHSGDLFDQVRPQNRAIDFALRQLLRLSEAGVETILISGNHSTPRLRETGSIFRIFEHLAHIHPLHEPGAKSLVFGDVTVVAIPHSTNPSLTSTLERIEPSKATAHNILVLHAGVTGSQTYKMDEFNEQTVPLEALTDEWNYVALGHYHEFKKIREGTYYSGSTERLGFGEVTQKKGIVEVDLDTGDVRFHQLKIRDMLDLEALDASGLASTEIIREARDRVSGASIDERIVRLSISNVAADAYRSLDVAGIKRLGTAALHFELKIDRLDAEGKSQSNDTQIGVLADEFKKYVTSLEYPDQKKAKLMEMGLPYLTKGDDE